MNEDQEERIVLAFERLATALRDLHDEVRRAGKRYWPQPKEQKEPVLSRVEVDEERDRKRQGARRRTIEEIIDPNATEEEEEYIGERTRQWLRDHPSETRQQTIHASPEAASGPEGAGTRTATDHE